VVDFPDPTHSLSIGKLYTQSFYRLCRPAAPERQRGYAVVQH
jgi:predicted membrane-bound spermidine synthase